MAQVGGDVRKHLADAGVEVKPYTALLDDIKTLALAHTKMWADPAKVLHPPCFLLFVFVSLISAHCILVPLEDPVTSVPLLL